MAKGFARAFNSGEIQQVQTGAQKQITRMIPLNQIYDSEFNSDMPLEDIDELAKSIKQNGLLEPIVVYDKGNGKYECLSGHRRRKALEQIGAKEIEAIVRPDEKDLIRKFRAHTDANTQNREKTTAFWLSRITVAKTVLKHTGFNGSKDQEVERISEMLGKGASKSQIYHLEAFEKLNPKLQELEKKGWVSVHTLYSSVNLTRQQQGRVADLVMELKENDTSDEFRITKSQFDLIVQSVKTSGTGPKNTPEEDNSDRDSRKEQSESRTRKNRIGYTERVERDSLKLIADMKKANTSHEKEAIIGIIETLEKSLKELRKTFSV